LGSFREEAFVSRIPLTELVVSVIAENRQVLDALREVEAAKERALKGEGNSGLQRELEQLGRTAGEANRKLDPLAGQARETAREMQSLSVAIKTGGVSLNDGLKRYQALEAVLKAQVGALGKAEAGHAGLTKIMKAAGEEGRRLEALNKAVNASYRPDDLTRYARGLTDVLSAERAGLTSKRDAITQLKSYQSALAQQTGALEKNGAEHRAVVKVMSDTGAAIKRLEGESDRLERSFRADYLRQYAGELRQIDVAVRSGTAGYDRAISQVDALSRELREQQGQLGTTGREFDQFSRLLQSAATQQERYQRAAEQAQRANDTAQIRTYGNELKQLEATLRDATVELGRLDSQQRALRYDPSGIRTYRTETEGLARAQQESLSAFSRVGQELGALQTRMRDYAQGANLGARESEALTRVMQGAEGATTRLAQAQEKAQAAFRADTLRTFRTDLEQITTSLRNNQITFEQAGRAVDALQGRMREFGTSVELSAREQAELARVMGAAETATRNFASAQERAQSALQAEQLVRYNAALLDLKRSLESGAISQEQFSAGARELAQEIERSRASVEQGGRAYVGYTQALTRVDSSLAQAEGRVRTFGVASGVTAGIGDQLQNVLYRMGPAGEAMGVAMFTASAGMQGAATSAKLLNVALAVGLVGAIIGVAVGAVALGKNMFALDTGLTDVAKTTGFTQTELGGLAKELQNIALNTGTPVKNLLDLATVAGSLGITGVKNVAQFTDVMNKLAIATDIVGEEGASQLAKFINVTKDAGQSVGSAAELVGNVIVRLGNSLATTEAPILAMAQRLAGLKTAANVSQPDILGLAGAFVSLGVSAELGGTNVTKIFTNMSLAASRGGAELHAFADAAGMTTAEFKTLVQQNPADAFIALVGGLKAAKDAGQDINPVLQGIVGNNSEMRRVLLAAVGGFDTFTLAMDNARDEAERMTAMNNELQTRLESLSGITSQIGQVFRYAFDSLALSAIPALKGALTGVLDFSRGMLGLEQTGDRAVTFASKAGGALGQFGQALVTGQSQADTFAAGLGSSMNTAASVVGGALGLIGQGITIGLRGALTAGVEQVGTFTRNVALALSSGGGAIGTIFTNLGMVVQNSVQFIGGVLARIPAYYQAVQAASGELANSVSRIFTSIGDILTGFGFIVYGGVVQPFVDMLAPIRAAATNVLLTVQNFIVGAAERFKPFTDFLGRVGLSVGDFLTDTTEKALGKINGLLSKGVVEYKGAGAAFTGTNESIGKGFDLIGRGVTGAANAVGDGSNAMTRALRDTQTTLEASVDDADGLTAANQALGEQSQQTAEDVGDLTPKIEGAGAAAGGAVAPTSEYAQKLKEMGPLLTDLTTRFRTTKLKLEIDGDPAEAMQRFRFIAENAGAAAEQALREGKLDRAEALLGLEAEARAEMERVKTVIREGNEAIGASFALAQGPAMDFIDALNSRNLDAHTASIIRSIGTYETFAERTERLTGVTQEQGAAMRQSQIDFENQRIATINATNVGQSYVESIIRGNEATGKAILEQRALATSLLTAQYAQESVARATTYTSEQYRLAGETSRTLAIALQEAENRFKFTGDAQQLAADKAEIYKTALNVLYSAGIDPAVLGLQKWVDGLEASEAAIKADAEATERAAEAKKRYEENLNTVREVQEALADASSISTDSIEEMIEALDAAAQGTGALAEQARQAQADLQALAVAREIATGLDEIAEAADRALSDIPNLSDGARAGLEALSAVAKEASAALSDGMVTPQEGIAILGAGIDSLAESFRDQLSPAAYAGVKAIDGVATAVAQVASGDYIGAAITGITTLVNAFVDFFTESAREAEQYRVAMEQAMEAVNNAVDQTIDNLQALTDFQVDTGGMDEVSANILNTQLDLIENQRSINAEIAEVNERRREALEGITDPATIAEINAGFDAEISAIEDKGRIQSDAILENGVNNAIAAGQSAGDFISGLVTSNGEIVGAIEGGSQAIGEGIGHYADSVGNDWDNAGSEMREAMEEALREQVDSFREATDDWEDALLDSRIRLAEAQGASDIELLILETNAKLLDAHRQFMDDMSNLEADKEEIIRAYILANPGVSRAEAEAYAESIVAPGRDALREEYANSSSAILLESQEQAKELGLSEKEFWRAVIEGNQEVLGDMTEEQRRAYLDFITLAREYGIELPAYIEEMYNDVHGAYASGGAHAADGVAIGNAEHTNMLMRIYSELRTLLGPAADEIIALIEETYQGQQEAHVGGGAQVAEGVSQGNAEHTNMLLNIYSQLRALLGPAAEEIIALIEGTYQEQYTAHSEGGAETGEGAREGGELAAQGIGAAEVLQTDAIRKLTQNLGVEVGRVPASVNPIISRMFGDMTTTFGTGTNLFSQGMSSGWGSLSSTLNTLGPQFGGAVTSVFGGIARNIDSGYGDLRLTHQSGSSSFQDTLAENMRREQSEFQSRSADLQRQIAASKGDERAALIREYEALRREHEAKSRDYQAAIDRAAGLEKGSVTDAARIVSAALGVMGTDQASAAQRAYETARQKYDAESKLFRALMGSASGLEKVAAIAAGTTISNGFSSMANAVVSSTQSAFAKQTSTYKTEVGKFVDAIGDQEDAIRRALDAVASLIKNFKYPALPKPPAVPQAAANAAFGGLPGGDLTSTSVDLPASVGAFAADSLPDYTAATSQARAYAAATTSLFDLFDGSKRSLSFTATQERALNLNVSFTGFTAALSAPIGLLERVADRMWETARFERETALINRETALQLANGRATTGRDLARNPRPRKVE
jgi:hypothetical protein